MRQQIRSWIAELNGVSIAAQPETQAYKDISGVTGRYSAGESPHRNTGGGTSQSAVEVQAGGDNYRFASEQSGKTIYKCYD